MLVRPSPDQDTPQGSRNKASYMDKPLNLAELPIPVLRADLQWSERQTEAGAELVVKEPITGRFHRFGPVEAHIIHLLRQGRDLAIIQKDIETRFGAELDTVTLIRFIDNLYQRGLLEGANTGGTLAPVKKRRVRGSPLFLLFDVHNPDSQLTRLHGALPWVFKRWFHVLSVIATTIAVLLVASNAAEIGRDFSGVLRWGSIGPAWLVILVTTTAHEYAHGLTCKHYGGKVTEMGFILMFFQPGMYVNVSDSWLFPEKSKRIWVMLAGTLFELVLWALAIIAWRITAPETTINFLALLVIGTSGLRLFMNLNPLIKLDGYYALSDWLEIPNLRQKAIGYFWGRARHPFAPSDPELSRRQRRIFFWYGLLGSAFTFWILSYMAILIGGFLTSQFQGIGFIIFAGLLVLIFKNPIKKLKARAMGQGAQNMEKPS